MLDNREIICVMLSIDIKLAKFSHIGRLAQDPFLCSLVSDQCKFSVTSTTQMSHKQVFPYSYLITLISWDDICIIYRRRNCFPNFNFNFIRRTIFLCFSFHHHKGQPKKRLTVVASCIGPFRNHLPVRLFLAYGKWWCS